MRKILNISAISVILIVGIWTIFFKINFSPIGRWKQVFPEIPGDASSVSDLTFIDDKHCRFFNEKTTWAFTDKNHIEISLNGGPFLKLLWVTAFQKTRFILNIERPDTLSSYFENGNLRCRFKRANN